MSYHNRNYWHSPMTHIEALAVVFEYDIYLECSDGDLNGSLNTREPIKLWEFREKISKKNLTYKPTSRLYWSDENMRVSFVQISKQLRIVIPKKENEKNYTINFKPFKGHGTQDIGKVDYMLIWKCFRNMF